MAERNPKYDVLRGLAILFVLLIHISADYAYADPKSGIYAVMNTANKLFATAVPTFVTLTVFLGLRSGKKRGALYVLKKAVPLTGLYLLWSAVYLWYNIHFGGMSLPKPKILIQKYLLQGHACYHLYYIVMLVQLYAVIALLSRENIKALKPRVWTPLVGGVGQLCVFTMFVVYVIYPFRFYNTAVLAIFYVTSITFGICLAADSDSVEADFRKYWWLYAAVMLITVLIRTWLTAHTELFAGDYVRRNMLETAVWELFIFGGVPIMFLLAELLRDFSPLALLGRHSLGIYFAHPLLFLILDQRFNFNAGGAQLILTGMAVKLIAALALSFAFSFAVEKLRKLFNKKSAKNV